MRIRISDIVHLFILSFFLIPNLILGQTNGDQAELTQQNIRAHSIVFYSERIEKTWKFKNTGNKNWSTKYKWEFKESNLGHTLANKESFYLDENIAPGNSYTFKLPALIKSFDRDEQEIKETWCLINDEKEEVPGGVAELTVKAVNCPISSEFEFPVGYPISNVEEQPYEVNWDFVDKDYDISGYHQSEDWNGIANGRENNDLGDPVYSIGYGYIVACGTSTTNRNKYILIRHVRIDAQGNHEPIYSRYYHLNSFLVKEGFVFRGQKIATIGNTGGDWSAHLDFGIIKENLFTVDCWKKYYELKNLKE